MTREDLLSFLRGHRLGVAATASNDGTPQAALVGIAVGDELEIVFDTLENTRKFANLRSNPRVALVVGWEREATAQLDGVAHFPTGADLVRARELYFSVYPDGRDRLAWPGIAHVLVRPTFVRFSDFGKTPAFFAEFGPRELLR